MILKIIKAEYINDYCIKVFFNDGLEKIVDLKNELYGTVFEPLKEMNIFKNFHIDCNTISWQNGADFAPEYLYEL
ncbi:MAG TPA: DUF2442 domain-containing protein [Candidatus Kapabacteria bacterium]|nr:DUF2442 domain-containing protein [Candidatus Kapabacteria bacterium]